MPAQQCMRTTWRQLFGIRSHDSGVVQDGSNSPVRLLVVTQNDRFYSSLVDAGSSCGWEVRRSSEISEAIETIREHSIRLVILDWDENGHDWRDGLGRLTSAHEGACVLLASPVMDDNLRQEVLRFRGYDVVPKRADREQIVRTVQFAWFWITAKKETRH